MRRLRDGDGSGRVQRVSQRTPSPKSLPGRGPLISHIPTGIWINLLRQDPSFSSPHPPGGFRIRLLQRFPSLPLLTLPPAATGQTGTGKAPRSLPGERRKSRSPHEALQGPSRIKEKYRPFPGFRRGSLPPSRSRGTPLPRGRSLLQEPLKDSREAPMAASG